MTYLGFPSGKRLVHVSTTLQYASFSSPPLKPPIAMPGVSRATISSQHSLRSPKFSPPCMMQNRFCVSGFLCAAMHLSSQRTDLCIASFILTSSGEVVTITSSNCMIISDPMLFWRDMECSGVRSMGVPSCGLRKRTPSSVILANFRRETIWNLQQGISFNFKVTAKAKERSPTHHYQSRYCDSILAAYALLQSCPVRLVQASSPSDMYC